MSPVTDVLFALSVVSAFYWLFALVCATAFAGRRPQPSGFCPPVTLLKPLCGADRQLYENLRSFCEQRYPAYQIIFGVRDPDDPAIVVVNRLIREFPDRDLMLVVSDRSIGSNIKVSNLSNLYRYAKYDTVVLADGDIRVGTDYLQAIVGPLRDERVGIVTCLYKGVAQGGVWSALGAMFINDWFVPSALVAARLGRLRYAFGATIACRRDALEAIGGFETLADYLADDYMLGWLAARLGFRVVLSPYVVQNVVVERQFKALFFHELRWTRTFRTVRPLGYFFSVITYGVPLSFLFLVASRLSGTAVVAFAGHLGLRLTARLILSRLLGARCKWSEAWLIPLRDALSFTLWALSFAGRTVRWNGHRFSVHSAGRLVASAPPEDERSLRLVEADRLARARVHRIKERRIQR